MLNTSEDGDQFHFKLSFKIENVSVRVWILVKSIYSIFLNVKKASFLLPMLAKDLDHKVSVKKLNIKLLSILNFVLQTMVSQAGMQEAQRGKEQRG